MKGLTLFTTALLAACVSHPPLPPYEPPAHYRNAPPEAAPTSASGQTSGGEWRVSLTSVRTAARAQQLSQQIANQGFRVETEMVDIDGGRWYRLVLPGYASEEEARAMLPVVKQELGFDSAWVPVRRSSEP